MTELVEVESKAEVDLLAILEDKGTVAVLPGTLSGARTGQLRRRGLQPALVDSKINFVSPPAVKDQSLRDRVDISPEVEVAPLKLHGLCGLSEGFSLIGRSLVDG